MKDALNLKLKKRVWYQPFCPSILEQEAQEVFKDYDGIPNEFMTTAYMVRDNKRDLMKKVINVDGSCRAQILKRDSLYRELLKEVKRLTGEDQGRLRFYAFMRCYENF